MVGRETQFAHSHKLSTHQHTHTHAEKGGLKKTLNHYKSLNFSLRILFTLNHTVLISGSTVFVTHVLYQPSRSLSHFPGDFSLTSVFTTKHSSGCFGLYSLLCVSFCCSTDKDNRVPSLAYSSRAL